MIDCFLLTVPSPIMVSQRTLINTSIAPNVSPLWESMLATRCLGWSQTYRSVVCLCRIGAETNDRPSQFCRNDGFGSMVLPNQPLDVFHLRCCVCLPAEGAPRCHHLNQLRRAMRDVAFYGTRPTAAGRLEQTFPTPHCHMRCVSSFRLRCVYA